jgi:hypothetical protein
MKLYDYLLKMEDGDELTVWDKVYDNETYFYCNHNDEDNLDLWDKSIRGLSKLLTVEEIRPNGVIVNLAEIIEKHIDKLNIDLFDNADIDDVMDRIDFILAGNVSEKWIEKFVNVLKD